MKKRFNVSDFYERNKSIIHLFLGLFLFWWLIRRVTNKIPQAPNRKVDIPVKQEDDKGASITQGQANSYAERLFDAMAISGTDEDTIYEILRSLSASDYNKVYNAFGLRNYLTFLGETPFFPFKMFSKPLSLTQWLVEELSADEFRKLKKMNPNLPI